MYVVMTIDSPTHSAARLYVPHVRCSTPGRREVLVRQVRLGDGAHVSRSSAIGCFRTEGNPHCFPYRLAGARPGDRRAVAHAACTRCTAPSPAGRPRRAPDLDATGPRPGDRRLARTGRSGERRAPARRDPLRPRSAAHSPAAERAGRGWPTRCFAACPAASPRTRAPRSAPAGSSRRWPRHSRARASGPDSRSPPASSCATTARHSGASASAGGCSPP